jgi:glutathione S-transferase
LALELHYHPLSSFCHKVLIALYEKDLPFERVQLNLGDPEERARFLALWPVGKFPLLRDGSRTVVESSIIVEYLDGYDPKRPRLLPDGPEALLVRFWDRFFDHYLHHPMQKIVGDRLRPEESRDSYGVRQAEEQLRLAYALVDREMQGKAWVLGDRFTLADCAAAPPLFYANLLQPIGTEHGATRAYLDRLKARPSYARALKEAEPYFHMFPGEPKPRL